MSLPHSSSSVVRSRKYSDLTAGYLSKTSLIRLRHACSCSRVSSCSAATLAYAPWINCAFLVWMKTSRFTRRRVFFNAVMVLLFSQCCFDSMSFSCLYQLSITWTSSSRLRLVPRGTGLKTLTIAGKLGNEDCRQAPHGCPTAACPTAVVPNSCW